MGGKNIHKWDSFWMSLKSDARVARADKVKEFITVFTDEGLQVVAGDIMPFHSILIEVVQDSQARFVIALKNRFIHKPLKKKMEIK